MRTLLYSLKRKYGRPISLVHLISSKVNTYTGEPDLVTITYSVQRAVFLPIELYQDFVSKMREAGYNYGDIYARGRAIILVAKKDLPSDYKLTFGDYLLHSKSQYKILEAVDLHAANVEAIELLVEELPVEDRITLDTEAWPC